MKKTTIGNSIRKFMEESTRTKKARADRECVMGLFNDYLANYGELESNVERDPIIVMAPISKLRPSHFRQFVCWFVIQKVLDRDKSQYVPVLRDFAQWLVESKVVGKAISKEILEMLDELQGEPERCEKMTGLLHEFANRDMPTSAEWRQDPKSYARKAAVLKAIHHEKPQRILDGYFTVARTGPGALWLRPGDPDDDEEDLAPRKSSGPEIGPVQVPAEAAKLARVGDRLCAAIGKMSDFWKLLETGGVYPG